MILKRTGSTATTDRPFERTSSMISGKMSSASVRTKITLISRSEYHKDLKPALTTGLNANLILSAAVIVIGSSYPFGYNIGVLNQVEPLIKGFYNQTFEDRYGSVSDSTLTITWSMTVALFVPGGMLGAFLGGFLADSFGRKKTILLSHIFVFIGAALGTACVAAKSPELLMIGRVFLGINAGMGMCIAPIFLSEISPFNYRGAFGTAHQLFITLGILLSSIFGMSQILGTADRWPYLILLLVVPAIISLAVLPFLPETPRYLLLVRNDRDAAEEALKFYRKSNDVDNDMEEMDTENQSKNMGVPSKKFTLMIFLKSKELRRPLFVACMLQLVQQFSGINAVFAFSNSIFESAQIESEHIPYAVVGTNAVNVLMTLIAVPLMDVAGRRPLLLIPMIVMIVDLIVMTICRVLYAQDKSLTFLAYGSIVCVIIYVIAFAVGLGPIPMMIGSELFRQEPRPLAMAIGGIFNWVSTFIILLSFPPIQEVLKDYTFIIYIVFLSGFFVFTYFFVPETKNKTFEEIAHQFAPGEHLEVEEIIEEEDEGEIVPPPAPPASNEDGVTINFAPKTDNNQASQNDKTA